jgi:hypothetical protein
MFENRLIEVPALGGDKVYASRIIASWVRKGGEIIDYHWGSTQFYRWCLSLGISDEDIKHMMNHACNGKMELETLAKKFMKSEKEPSE